MQAPPAVAIAVPPATRAEWPNILPGPFILLLLLPALPLLLFSIGARPPDTHSLPFSTDDIWQTTAFITVAGGVVLCVALYPGMMSDLGAWVKGGAEADGRPFWAPFTRGVRDQTGGPANGAGVQQVGDGQYRPLGQDRYSHPAQPAHPAHAYNPAGRPAAAYHQPQQPLQPQVRMRYEDVPRKPGRVEYRPEEYRQDRNGNVFRRPASKRYIPGEGGGKRLVLETVDMVPNLGANSDTSVSMAGRHLAALRNSPMSPWYSTHKPPLALGLLIGIGIIAMLVVVTGKILHAAYDKDKVVARKTGKGQDIEAWYIRELQKRKVETEQETLKRDKEQEAAFVGRLRKMTDEERRNKEIKTRRDEIEVLKKELKKRRMPIVGLEWDFEGRKKKKNTDTTVSRGVDKLKGIVGVGKKDDAKAKGKQSKTPDEAKEPGKLKKMLLGPLATGAHMDISLSAKKPSASGDVKSGPGWRAADDAIAHAAIRGGAARAENLANSLVKIKAEG